MAERVLTVTLPDGSKGTRRTARDYTHVIAILVDGVGWRAANWCGSLELANKQLRSLKNATVWVPSIGMVKILERRVVPVDGG